MEKIENIIRAFEVLEEESIIKEIRYTIENELLKFITYFANSNPSNKILNKIESRIKTIDSFKEKAKRKDYINTWEITDNIIDNKKIICEQLPDLIGFRIGCFFDKDEKLLYSKLETYYKEGKFGSKIELNFNENTIQDNGLKIYKVTGKYLNEEIEYCFEIQIKSLFHNVWGEVEHKKIYKNNDYVPDTELKKGITQNIYDILTSVNGQLLTIFNTNYHETILLQSLFYNYSKDKIENKIGTSILEKHYDHFFKIFKNQASLALLKNYIGSLLLEQEYQKKSIEIDETNAKSIELKEKIKKEFLPFNIIAVYEISNLLVQFRDYDQFLFFLSKYLLEITNCVDENEEYGFDEGEEPESGVSDLEDIINYLEDYFKRNDKRGVDNGK